VQLLKLLARHAAPLPASAIARDLDLPRSTTYHLLGVLQDEGFVVHLPEERRYGLGVGAYELGSAYLRQDPLRWIGQPALTRLVAATTHNAHLAVLQGREVLYVIEERAPGRPGLVTDVGVRLPAHLTASGLAMLAALPEQQTRSSPAAASSRAATTPVPPR
jgi:DNA-binding IclR family transcriptional regulator